MFVLSAGTDYADAYPTYRAADPHAKVTAAVDAAAGRSYEGLRGQAPTDYRDLFDRVKLDIGQKAAGHPDRQAAARRTPAAPRPTTGRWRRCSSSTAATC